MFHFQTIFNFFSCLSCYLFINSLTITLSLSKREKTLFFSLKLLTQSVTRKNTLEKFDDATNFILIITPGDLRYPIRRQIQNTFVVFKIPNVRIPSINKHYVTKEVKVVSLLLAFDVSVYIYF